MADTVYNGARSGPEIDTGVKTALGYPSAETGAAGQVPTKQSNGTIRWRDLPQSDVRSFKGRTGAVVPQSGDYTAAMVGALPKPSASFPTGAGYAIVVSANGSTTGWSKNYVQSFKGRTGAVMPQDNDYTAEQVYMAMVAPLSGSAGDILVYGNGYTRPRYVKPTANLVGAVPYPAGGYDGYALVKDGGSAVWRKLPDAHDITAEAEKAAGEAKAAAESAARSAQDAAAQERIVREAGAEQVSLATEQVELAARQADRAEEAAQGVVDMSTASESWAVGGTGSRAGEDTDNSRYWAGLAQAAAQEAAVPPVEGVYNVILTDRVTSTRYALMVYSGRLALLEVSSSMEATDGILIDSDTGVGYKLIVSNGKIAIEEAS